MMTPEKFEHYVSLYGPDYATWPEAVADAAKAVAVSADGERTLAGEAALDQLLCAAGSAELDRAAGNGGSFGPACDMFLTRLAAIPAQTSLPTEPENSAATAMVSASVLRSTAVTADRNIVDGFVFFFADTSRWLAPKAIFSQAAVFAAVLSLGIFVGGAGGNLMPASTALNSAVENSEAYQLAALEVDISASLFDADLIDVDEDYLLDLE